MASGHLLAVNDVQRGLVDSEVIDWNLFLIGVAALSSTALAVLLIRYGSVTIVDVLCSPYEQYRQGAEYLKKLARISTATRTARHRANPWSYLLAEGPVLTGLTFAAFLFAYHFGLIFDRAADSYVDFYARVIGQPEDSEIKQVIFKYVYPDQPPHHKGKLSAAYYNARAFLTQDEDLKGSITYMQTKIALARAWCLCFSLMFVALVWGEWRARTALPSSRHPEGRKLLSISLTLLGLSCLLWLLYKLAPDSLSDTDVGKLAEKYSCLRMTTECISLWAARGSLLAIGLDSLLVFSAGMQGSMPDIGFRKSTMAVWVFATLSLSGWYAWSDYEREIDGKIFTSYRMLNSGDAPPPCSDRPYPVPLSERKASAD